MNDVPPVGNGAGASSPGENCPRPGSTSELHLLKLAGDFFAAHNMIDALMAREATSDTELLALHKQWEEACSAAAAIPASTEEGQRAKARVLLASLDVIAPHKDKRALHERLAASLARDVAGF